MNRPLSIGIEDFKELIINDYYYVDKTLLIKELLDNKGKVSLFTRPRRFGKTLALSMIKYFFERGYDQDGRELDYRALFEGLAIMDAGEEYTKHLGQYPVISLSLKVAKQPTFEMAQAALVNEIAKEYARHNYLIKSGELLSEEIELFQRIRQKKAETIDYAIALEFLSRCLKKASGKNVIILIDEYDVPLENAFFNGFYDQMIGFIRSLFESALKTNGSLEFAVITGCLRISRESIFTGLNNLRIISILNAKYAEHFGFTEAETLALLTAYGLEDRSAVVREWYDGYRFGKKEVYNPWSILLYTDDMRSDAEAFPKPYWANTSSNSIVRELVERSDTSVKLELEKLIAGGTVEKPVHEDITYDEIYRTQDNIWNFLFFTGYLKKVSERFAEGTTYLTLAIPNEEVKYIYKNSVMEWFAQRIRTKDFSSLYQALLNRDAGSLEKQLCDVLMETVSFYDYKEAYYHGFLAGLLKMMDGYMVKSNRESGLGRNDIQILSVPYEGIAIVIEVKVADTAEQLDQKAQEALQQIQEQQYDAEFRTDGYKTFIHYGIAFYKKACLVLVEG